MEILFFYFGFCFLGRKLLKILPTTFSFLLCIILHAIEIVFRFDNFVWCRQHAQFLLRAGEMLSHKFKYAFPFFFGYHLQVF